jgi:hypothetical protein
MASSTPLILYVLKAVISFHERLLLVKNQNRHKGVKSLHSNLFSLDRFSTLDFTGLISKHWDSTNCKSFCLFYFYFLAILCKSNSNIAVHDVVARTELEGCNNNARLERLEI